MDYVDDLGSSNQGRRIENEVAQNASVHAIVVGSSASFERVADVICTKGTGIIT